jgi:hypothetical protein
VGRVTVDHEEEKRRKSMKNKKRTEGSPKVCKTVPYFLK